MCCCMLEIKNLTSIKLIYDCDRSINVGDFNIQADNWSDSKATDLLQHRCRLGSSGDR